MNSSPFSARNALFILLSVALVGGMWGVLRDLVAYASDWDNNNASQVLVIPFITAALIYLNKKEIFDRVQYAILPGGLLMIVGIGLLLFAKTRDWQLEKGDQLAVLVFPLLVILWGGFLLFYGTNAFKTSLFALLFLVFSMPIPSPIMNGVIYVLQHASAEVSYVLLKLTGMPIYKDDVSMLLPTGLTVVVAKQCSGIRSGISLLILTLVAGNVVLRSWPRRVLLLVAAIPIVIFKNA